MKPRRAMRVWLTALLCAVAGSTWTPGAPRRATGAATAETCLTGDPYNLARLAEVISSPTPVSGQVRIGEDITVAFVRAGSMSDDPTEVLGRGREPGGAPEPIERPVNVAPVGSVPLRIFNTRTKFEYRVSMSDDMLRAINACHDRNGLTEAGGPADIGAVEGLYSSFLPTVRQSSAPNGSRQAQPIRPVPAAQPDGWSDGDDTRILRTPTTAWPWRAITQSSSWPNGEQSRCTMTLIGPRHLVTAAHCLVNFGTSTWKTRKLTPARNGINSEPYGVSQMTPTPPAGEEAWYIVPDPWLDPATPDTIDKYQWDIGLVLMADRLGAQTGWMGYGAYPASELNKRYHMNRGYPGCQSDYAEKPDGCQMARLYGDTKECDIGDYHHPGSNGWNREFSFSCDISRGHSGSAIYHYRNRQSDGKLIPVVVAVVSWHECLTCDDSDEHPNHARRITPWVLDSISWLREQFP